MIMPPIAKPLLNKNLNFIPKPKVYKKGSLYEELQPFYRLIKLKICFKDNENNKLTTKKEKWTLNKNYHTVLTYIVGWNYITNGNNI